MFDQALLYIVTAFDSVIFRRCNRTDPTVDSYYAENGLYMVRKHIGGSFVYMFIFSNRAVSAEEEMIRLFSQDSQNPHAPKPARDPAASPIYSDFMKNATN